MILVETYQIIVSQTKLRILLLLHMSNHITIRDQRRDAIVQQANISGEQTFCVRSLDYKC